MIAMNKVPRVLVLDVGRTMIKSALFNNEGQICDYTKFPSTSMCGDELIIRAIKVAHEYFGFDIISIAISGQTDVKAQTVLFEYSNWPNTKGLEICRPVGDMFRQAFSQQVVILNDSNAAALGESKFGAGKGTDNFICLTFGTGVGGGIIIDNKILEGHRGIAAEVGHMVTHKGGRLCGCGNRGCYEQYASVTTLIRNAQLFSPEIRNGFDLLEVAKLNTKLLRIIRTWTDEVIVGLETLTYIFNPSLIVLGGGIFEQEEILNLIKERFYKHIIPTFSNVELRAAKLGNKAGLFGAYSYALQQVMPIKNGKEKHCDKS